MQLTMGRLSVPRFFGDIMGELYTSLHAFLLLPFLLLFFIPTFIAGRRRAEHYWWIALSNLVVGGTGVGWVVVLIWALHSQPQRLASPAR